MSEITDADLLASLIPGQRYGIHDIARKFGISTGQARLTIIRLVGAGRMEIGERGHSIVYHVPIALKERSSFRTSRVYSQNNAAWDVIADRIADAREIKSKF